MLRSILLLAASILPFAATAADGQADIDSVNRWIDRYGAYQEQLDAAGMSVLMAKDRVCVSHHFGGRRTDNVLNMKIQQAQLDAMRKELPGTRDFVEDRERLIHILADGKVATVSMFRYMTRIYPPGTSDELRKKYPPDAPAALSLVLEKRGADWILVYTHASEM